MPEKNASQEKEISHSLKLLAKTSVIVFITIFISKLLTYLYRVVIAREYGSEIYGAMSLLLVVLGIAVALFSFGFFEGLLKFVPKYLARKESEKSRYLINFTFLFVLVSGVIGGILFFVFSGQLSQYFFDGKYLNIIQIFSLIIPFWIVSNVFLYSLNAFEKIGWYSFLSDVLVSFSRLSILLVLIFFGMSSDSVFISLFSSWILLLVFSYFVFSYYSKRILLSKSTNLAERRILLSEFFRYSLFIALSGIIVRLNSWLDSLSIGFFLENSDVGFYNVASPIAMLLIIVPELFTPLFFPLINREYSQNKNHSVSQLSKQVGKWIFIINLPLFLITLAFPGTIINILFGKEYLVAENALRILSIGIFVLSLSSIPQRLLLMKGHSKLIFLNSIIALIVNLSLNIILIPLFGINGAAIATMVTFIILGLVLFIQSFYYTGIFPLQKKSLFLLIISIPLVSLLFLIKGLIEINLFSLIIVGLFFALLYYFLVFSLGFLDKRDFMIISSFKNKFFSIAERVNSYF